MKKLKLTAEDKAKLIAKFTKKLEEYEGSDKVEFEAALSEKAKNKIRIWFTPMAYAKSNALVQNFSGEVGWSGLMKRLTSDTYLVYDILVYPQVVSGARTLDPTKTNDWYEKNEDKLDFMHFQAHSHVEMSTTPSVTDMDNQKEIVKNCQGHGYKLFQIWNKKGDINTFFYDLENNLLYDRNDVEIDVVETAENTLNSFIEEAKSMVEDMKIVPFTASNSAEPKPYGNGYTWKKPTMQDEEVDEKIRDPFYWMDGNGHEGWR